jgi:hypothetical protein
MPTAYQNPIAGCTISVFRQKRFGCLILSVEEVRVPTSGYQFQFFWFAP